MRRLALALLCLLALVATGCGSRADTDSADDSGLDASSDSSGGSDEGGGAALGPDSTELGTIANPCSDEPAEGEAASDVPGVTEDTIRIGVISDKENPAVPLPTVGIEESVKAFVEFCNAAGGIHGRQLELQTYDSQISRTEEATNEACRDDLFALVGTGSVQDQQGITTREGCGLPEVGAYSATTSRAQSEDFFSPIPGLDPDQFNVGPCKYIAEQFPDAVGKAAMIYTDLPAPRVRGEQTVDACEAEAGFDYVVQEAIPFGDSDYSALVADMKQKGIEYFSMVSATSDTLALLEEMQTQGVEPEVIDLAQQYYDPAVAEAAVTDGAHVLTNTVPFVEAGETPVLQLYLDYMDEVGAGEDKISTLGVQAFDAGLLFATAAAAAGADLTRESLVSQLEGIHEWDGGGIQMTTDPGAGTTQECVLYLTVADGEFQREYPDEGFACDPDDLYTSDQSFDS